ncbi:hypothetical protein [Streptomyces sp. NPDC088258]|uniref:hypothetical protein n=1 Tax=Streptomyces sp. NPDC088258 TaxID=3365849 RepID=UPI0037F14EC3
MGMYTSAYLAYGIQIVDTEPGILEEANLGAGVSFLYAGRYDNDMTFLVTEWHNVDLGSSKALSPQYFADGQYAVWDELLKKAAGALDLSHVHQPAWLVIADVD